MNKMAKLGILILFFVSLNFSALQDWDVPLIGTQTVEAGVPGCEWAIVACWDSSGFSVDVGCLYTGTWLGINCQPCYSAC